MKEYKLILKVLNTSIQNLQFKHIKISLLKKATNTMCRYLQYTNANKNQNKS